MAEAIITQWCSIHKCR